MVSKLSRAWHTRKMLDAAKRGDSKGVAACLEKGADARGSRGAAINGAVGSGDLELFEVLVRHDPGVVADIRLGVLAEARYQAWRHDGKDFKLQNRLRSIVLRADIIAGDGARKKLGGPVSPSEDI
jgi:hypothetical protein